MLLPGLKVSELTIRWYKEPIKKNIKTNRLFLLFIKIKILPQELHLSLQDLDFQKHCMDQI